MKIVFIYLFVYIQFFQAIIKAPSAVPLLETHLYNVNFIGLALLTPTI